MSHAQLKGEPEPFLPEELTLDGRVMGQLERQTSSPLREASSVPEQQSRLVRPTILLLSRPHALDGVTLLAFCSSLIGPLALEVIFAHRSLWFETESGWQSYGVSMVWRVWLLLGSILLVGWGMNRAATGGVAGYAQLSGVLGHTSVANPQRHYASLVTLIGSLIYILFGVPTWFWVARLGLTTDESWLYMSGVSALSLIVIPQLLTFASATSQRREWILLMLGTIWVWLITRWIWDIS